MKNNYYIVKPNNYPLLHCVYYNDIKDISPDMKIIENISVKEYRYIFNKVANIVNYYDILNIKNKECIKILRKRKSELRLKKLERIL